MNAAELKFGIPDIDLGCISGTRINPSSFAGHELIVLFCPSDANAAAREIAAYHRYSIEFANRDAWLLTFADESGDIKADGLGRVLTIPDPNRHAWVAFCNATAHPEVFDRSSGATFLFMRGGGLHRYWLGRGHADEVLAELQIPSFDHTHYSGS